MRRFAAATILSMLLVSAAWVSKGIEGPKILDQIDPGFTQCAYDQKFTGTTIVSLEVDNTGAIHDIQIVKPSGCGLDDQAVRAVQQWRFAPARRNGRADRRAPRSGGKLQAVLWSKSLAPKALTLLRFSYILSTQLASKP